MRQLLWCLLQLPSLQRELPVVLDPGALLSGNGSSAASELLRAEFLDVEQQLAAATACDDLLGLMAEPPPPQQNKNSIIVGALGRTAQCWITCVCLFAHVGVSAEVGTRAHAHRYQGCVPDVLPGLDRVRQAL